jgi:hypothetical protein
VLAVLDLFEVDRHELLELGERAAHHRWPRKVRIERELDVVVVPAPGAVRERTTVEARVDLRDGPEVDVVLVDRVAVACRIRHELDAVARVHAGNTARAVGNTGRLTVVILERISDAGGEDKGECRGDQDS